MSSRCGGCGGRLVPAMRRCRRCGAAVDHERAFAVVTLARPPAPYASGDRVAQRYLVVENHGAGPLGTVYRARTESGRAVALKILAPDLLTTREERELFVAELGKLAGREMPHVALPLDVGVCAHDLVFIVAPWVFGASLRTILRAYHAADRRLDADQALGILQGVALALRELHTTAAHGAVYPENVHVTADAIVLTDPALAATLPPSRLARVVEHFPDVVPYLAPEVRAGKRANAGADLHGLGALASELLAGDPSRARTGKLSLPALGPEIEGALRALVSAQVAKRAGALPQLLERLSRAVGQGSLPMYAPLPLPLDEQRTRRIVARDVAGTGRFTPSRGGLSRLRVPVRKGRAGG